MNTKTKRALAVAGTFLVTAAVSVVAGMLTQNRSTVWVVFFVSLIVVGVFLKIWLTLQDHRTSRRQEISEVKGKKIEQKMSGPGEQSIKGTKVKGEIIQDQSG